jgi:hypothetical protein
LPSKDTDACELAPASAKGKASASDPASIFLNHLDLSPFVPVDSALRTLSGGIPAREYMQDIA